MTNSEKELFKHLKWAEKQEGGFYWVTFQEQFGLDTQKMNEAMQRLFSNMPSSKNLVDHRLINGIDQNLLFITNNGLEVFSKLRSEKNFLHRFFHNPWTVGIGIFIFTLVVSNFFKPDKWFPIYYPNPSDLNVYYKGPLLKKLEQCRDWINAESIRRNQPLGEYDYECAKNCDLSGGEPYICEETTQ